MTRRKRPFGQFVKESRSSPDKDLSDTADAVDVGMHKHDAVNVDDMGDWQTIDMKKVNEDDSGDWQTVEPSKNKRRKRSLKQSGYNYPSIKHSSHARLHSFVKLGDLQDLALYLFTDAVAPQWCQVQYHSNVRNIVFLMVPGLESGIFDGSIPLSQLGGVENSAENPSKNQPADPTKASSANAGVKKTNISPDDYYPVKLEQERLPSPLQPLAEMFPHLWPIKTPGDPRYSKMHSPIASILSAPTSGTYKSKYTKGPRPEGRDRQDTRTPITTFLASVEDLIGDGYVIHPAHYSADSSLAEEEKRRRATEKTTAADGWIDSSGITNLSAGEVPDSEIEKGSITVGRKVLSMDCEMCQISPRGERPSTLSLARVTLVDWNGDIVLDELVKPQEPITDYLTQFSGITATMLENVKTTLPDIQRKLLSLITPRTILIGHSLHSDLKVLKFTHPFVVDTAMIFPHNRGPPLKESLRSLAKKYLGRDIQQGHGSVGHSSIEDARACLDLVKQKCEKGPNWGTPAATAESIFKRLQRSLRSKRDKSDFHGSDEPYPGAVVDWGDPKRGYGSQAAFTVSCTNDTEVVAGIKLSLDTDSDLPKTPGPSPPPGGCNFVWARFRELEAFRGWWNQSKTTDNDDLRNTAQTNDQDATLGDVLKKTVDNIRTVYDALPKCTAFIVYSGSGDPRDLVAMQALQNKHKEEFKHKKWDELSVKWTDVEESKLRRACEKARSGIGFITVK